ncbi:Ataxin-1 [Merluccius polli]|uniref:Ataxin-1 n=1 Tax=Merluccius polli TaxID=89951 RepID=A0AA47N209_MERPO|nr:Ataxin-1 [Merluccius polli]
MEPDEDASPTKKRNQIEDSRECDAAMFKVPYPYKNLNSKLPLQPTARRAATLYQPWTQTHTATSRTRAPSLAPHHSWAGWTEFHNRYGGSDLPHRSGPSAGHLKDFCTAVVQQGGHLRYPLDIIPVTVLPRDAERSVAGYRRDAAPKLRERFSLETFPGRAAPRGDRGPWGRRRDHRTETPHGCVSPTSLTPSFLIPSLPLAEDGKPQEELLYEHLVARGAKHPRTIPSPVSSSPSSSSSSSLSSSSPSPSSSLSTSSGYTSQHEFNAFQAAQKTVSRCSSVSSPPPSPEPFPWLLPHFAAGSLIELRDGRLKRVEDLRTEDFLLGSAARRGLQLSCCTVQSITSSSSSSSSSSSFPPALSRLLILLHDQNSQELVDVYMEYPFFVRGRGWSSCCPERTARLCGLSCGQLSVGDVCLALTPASPGGPPHPGEAAAGWCTPKEQAHPRASPPAQVQDTLEGPLEGE